MTTITRTLTCPADLADPRGAEAFVREWIDPAYLRLVQFLSAPAAGGQPAEGLFILAHLCRRAIQPNLFPSTEVPHVARLTFRGIVGLCTGSTEQLYGTWPCGRETTLKWLILLEAVTVIYRYRCKGETVVMLPLGRRLPLDLPMLIPQIEAYERKYSNKKTRALLNRSKERIHLCSAAQSATVEGEGLLDRPAPAVLQQQLLSQLGGEGIDPARCAQIARWFTLGSATEPARSHLRREEAVASSTVSRPADAGRILRAVGDSKGTGGRKGATSASAAGDSTTTESPGRDGIAPHHEAGGRDTSLTQGSGEAGRLHDREGDSNGQGDSMPQSNLESPSLSVITLRGSRFESEEALLEEAERYVRLLDGPLPPKSKWTRGVVTGYKNCIEREPLLSAISLINTLLRLHCPLQGKEDPLRIPRKWFHISFNKYADAQDPMPLTEDIRSFVQSPYSYEEIAQALAAWYDRNHASVWRRPCVDDLVAAGLLEEVLVEPAPVEEPPPYPSPEDPWGPESCLALFDYYREYLLPPELAERAARAVTALVGGGDGPRHWCRFDRFEVESVIVAWLEGDPALRELLQGAGAGDAFPDVWVTADAMEAAWDIVRAQLLATGQYVELDDGALLSCDEFAALYERVVSAREEEHQRDAYEHSLTYYLRLLQEEESAYKDAADQPPAAEPVEHGTAQEEPTGGEERAEWRDPESALQWALPLRKALPFDLYGLEIRMTRQWHCVLVVWSRESPEDDTLTLYNSEQVAQLIEGVQESAREREDQKGEVDATAVPAALSGTQEQTTTRETHLATACEETPLQHRPTEWGPDG